MLRSQTVEVIRRAFPRDARSTVEEVLASVSGELFSPTVNTIGRLTVGPEELFIPSRVYFEPRAKAQSLHSAKSEAVLSCVYSRHHSGFVREEHLRRLLTHDFPWVVPYVIQLVGEYVIEILHVIDSHREILARESYRTFVETNPGFMERTRQRVISYWNEYYRRRTARLQDHVGFRLIEALGIDPRHPIRSDSTRQP